MDVCLVRHAKQAREVATVGHRNSELGRDSALGVDEKIRSRDRSFSNQAWAELACVSIKDPVENLSKLTSNVLGRSSRDFQTGRHLEETHHIQNRDSVGTNKTEADYGSADTKRTHRKRRSNVPSRNYWNNGRETDA